MGKSKEYEIKEHKIVDNYIVNKKGQKTAVILPITEYRKLHKLLEKYAEILEDLHDLAVVAERRDEPTINFEKLKSKLKKDGLL